MKVEIIAVAPFESKVEGSHLTSILLDLFSGLISLNLLCDLLVKFNNFYGSVNLNDLLDLKTRISIYRPEEIFGMDVVEHDLVCQRGVTWEIHLKVAVLICPSSVNTMEVNPVEVNLSVSGYCRIADNLLADFCCRNDVLVKIVPASQLHF